MKNNDLTVIELTEENVESLVYEIRGQKVMLDFDLARIYGYTTRDFNNQVKHNIERFDEDFRFQLTKEELENSLRWKFSTINKKGNMRGQHFKYLPYAFTEKGVYMLMSILKGHLAIQQSKTLIRLFEKPAQYRELILQFFEHDDVAFYMHMHIMNTYKKYNNPIFK